MNHNNCNTTYIQTTLIIRNFFKDIPERELNKITMIAITFDISEIQILVDASFPLS